MQTNQENFCHKKLSVPKLYSWLPNDYNPEKFPTSKIWIWPLQLRHDTEVFVRIYKNIVVHLIQPQ